VTIPFVEIIADLLIFGAVALMTVAIMREAERLLEQRRRLGSQTVTGGGISAPSLLAKRASENAFFRWVQVSTSINDPDERNQLRQALMLAGFTSPNAAIWYVIARFSLAILLPVLFIVSQFLSAKPETGMGVVIWPIILCAVGLFAPSRILTSLASSRQQQLEFEFPDALDLMVVCVEAGLSLDAAFVRVGQETKESHPRISEEFERVSEQLRAGRARPDALRAMADRTGVPAIKSFAALLIQTEMLGAGIAQTLRTFSNEMRETRFIKAEEKAMRIPVLMTIPLVACILPVIVTALLLPALIDVMRTLMPALTGGRGG
jgi:tight adherence protein C